MELKFRNIELTDKDIIDEFTSDKNLSWEYNFAMVWCWNVFDTTKICILPDMLFVYTEFYGKAVFFPPYLKDESKLETAMRAVCSFCRQNNLELLVNGIPKDSLQYLDSSHFRIEADRNNFDYIYSAEDLKNLAGKKFHAKRNYVTRFEREYAFELFDYEEKYHDDVYGLYKKWYVKSVDSTLDLEGKAIERALTFYKELDLKIAVLCVDNKTVAFSISNIRGKVAHTLFEKGDIDYVGVYQAINKFTANRYFTDCEYINRQEDMGIEGLRKVKESYNPVMLFEKYRVTCGRKENKPLQDQPRKVKDIKFE